MICAAAAAIKASSPLPPEKDPVLRSVTKGQGPKITGWPGFIRSISIRLASVSAKTCTNEPARAAGDVAPD